MGSPNKDTKSSDWTLVVIIFIATGLFLLLTGNKPQNLEMGSELSRPIDQRVNEHLRGTDIQLQYQQNEIRSQIPVPRNSAPEIEDPLTRPMPLDRTAADHAIEITRSNEASARTPVDLTPGQLIDRQLAKEQFLKDYDEKYKSEYVEQFLENAREKGYDIQLNDELEIIGVQRRPIDKPMRFPNSVGGSPGASK